MPYYVYMILCKDGSFYTGYSKNLASRMKLHVKGKGARYTRIHKPQKLVYAEEFSCRAEAMRRERRLKMLTHRQKLRLTKISHQPIILRKLRRRFARRGSKSLT